MGTKRELAGDVAQAITSCRTGPVLDAFAGMCSVGEAVGTARQVWINDAQVFAFEVGTALFTARTHPVCGLSVADLYHSGFQSITEAASGVLEVALSLERQAVEAVTFETFEIARRALQAELIKALPQLASRNSNLFTRTYADSFFGVRQAIELDAILKVIGWTGSRNNTCDQRRWSMIALGRAMLRISNSTGHFAQYLKPKIGNFRTFQRQRKRSVWSEWIVSHDEMAPVGDQTWRIENKAFNMDALAIFETFKHDGYAPSVVYADPPYTNDQYSRYYHLFETLALYDYPQTTGAGLYRTDRFSTSFSLKSKAATSITSLARSVRDVGADLVLSYPTNGLAYGSGFDPESILKSVYGNVECFRAISHDHSTLGASKGAAKSQVIEKIYVARA